ncbi:tRNA glutamyl-Q(34) synthetase GluQRS [Propionibacterium sp.]|uniref:tRNA glutamyl-Q(34) synthetase GluQRS n=1 Tax=Propionibacterium sp. TaxID=1977903 RepID=UPI0039EC4645
MEQPSRNARDVVAPAPPTRGAGRFAPSPTSELHLGNLRTALLAWLVARAEDLSFVVRIEDLDRARVAAAPGVADHQLRDLDELGLDWDGPVLRQSDRIELYRQAIEGLNGYECFCTRKEIALASSAPHQEMGRYPGTCAHLGPEERERRRATRRPAWRVRAHGARQQVHDRFAGVLTGDVDDFVLVRNDGTPAYNLAVVVDDAAQCVTQVTRGRDLLSSSPRQAWLATTLGHPVPDYVHVGLVVDGQGRRLAKRDGDLTLPGLHAIGLTTPQVVGMLADSCELPHCESAQELLRAVRGTGKLHSPALAEDWTVPTTLAAPGPR